MIYKFLLASFFSLILLSVAAIHYNDPIRRYIEHYCITSFERAIECKVERARLSSVSILSPRLVFSDVRVCCSKKGNDWSWRARHVQIDGSWWEILCSRMIAIEVMIDDFFVSSILTDKWYPAVADHIQTFFSDGPETSVLSVKNAFLKNGIFNFHHKKSALSARLHSDISLNENQPASITFFDGVITKNNVQISDNICGMLTTTEGQVPGFEVEAGLSLDLPLVGKQVLDIKGAWSGDQGSCTITSLDRSFALDPITAKKKDSGFIVTLQGESSLSPFFQAMHLGLSNNALRGSCETRVHCFINDGNIERLQSYITLHDVAYEGISLCSLWSTTLLKENALWKGTLHAHLVKALQLRGVYRWNEDDNNGKMYGYTVTPLRIPGTHHWYVDPREGTIDITSTTDGASGIITCIARHKVHEGSIAVKAEVLLKNRCLNIAGSCGDYPYELSLCIDQGIKNFTFCCRDQKEEKLLEVKQLCKEPFVCTANMKVLFFQKLLKQMYGISLQGKGMLSLRMGLKDGVISVQTHLNEGVIRLPRTYNFITTFESTFDYDISKKKLLLHSLLSALHKGTLTSHYGHLQWDDDMNLTSFRVPFFLDSCLLNIKKNIFAVVSGRLLLEKKHEEILPHCVGELIIDRAQVKENIFSDALPKKFFGSSDNSKEGWLHDMHCSLDITTATPMKIQTDFLETAAAASLHIGGRFRKPEIKGVVQLNAGVFLFPYRPLHIVQGKLYFSAGNLYDPTIELIAKNNVKKYNITLQVSGSLRQHVITLSSSPVLTQEQIVALLLVGSEQESLNIVMPALIMHNLTNLVFGNDQSLLKLDHHFKSLLKPFKYVHLVPSFSDQTGRGGLRGAIEIDVNDRLRALIQKNFSLSEDTRFEFEYALSDDMSIRGIRDERSDLGAEVEMRLKF